MNNVLVPISVRLNSLTDDAVTVGLLAFNDHRKFFDVSSEKMRIVNSYLDKNTKSYLEKALNSLKTNLLKEDDLKLINFSERLISEKYVNYLSKYSNGLIKFGDPKGFAMVLDKVTFNKAFKSFVGAEPGKTKHVSDSLRNQMRAVLKEDAFKKVDVFYTVKPSIVPGIYTSHKLDFIGVNGSPYAGLAVDFTKNDVEVDKSILTFNSIVTGIEKRAESFDMSHGIYELYFNEPESVENKALLDKVRKDTSKGFNLLEFEKIDTVIERLNKGNYKKFSESILDESA